MAKSPKTKRKKLPKTVLKLPDLEHSKSAVLNSLASASSQRSIIEPPPQEKEFDIAAVPGKLRPPDGGCGFG